MGYDGNPSSAPSGMGLCNDSDNGKDYWTKGTLTTPKGEQFTDFCSKGSAGSSAAGIKVDSSDYVYEYYCFDDKTKTGGTEIVKCDGGCKDGKCVKLPSSDACNKIIFADASLEKAIKEQLNIPANKDVTVCDAKSVKLLELSAKNIKQLSGLEYFTNLETLYLDSSQISDISVLSGLMNLQSLSLDYLNQISDISVLSGLTKLQTLSLAFNPISDISALSGLTKLQTLSLAFNPISDISALSGLTKLQDLGLSSNEISDISALKGLMNLKFLFFDFN